MSDGAVGALTLEWVGDPPDATRWQFRQRSWEHGEPLRWEDWAHLPHGCASTRACRLTGLPGDAALDCQVRAAGGPASAPAEATTPAGRGPPGLSAATVVEGDGAIGWAVAGFTITIPDGVRLQDGGGFVTACIQSTPCISHGVQVRHFPSGSGLTFSVDGRQVIRYVSPVAGDQAEDVNAIFDQVVASVSASADE